MLRYGSKFLIPCLHKIVMTISNVYPECWSVGYITPIHKGDNTESPDNYRGITITSQVGKVFNDILNDKLEEFLTENEIISKEQIVFTRKCRTSDHIFILKTLIDTYTKEPSGKLFACFVDFRKAFDTVLHSALFIKLSNIGITHRYMYC